MKSAPVFKNGRVLRRRVALRARCCEPGFSITALAVAACFGAGGSISAYANPTNPAVVNGAAKFTTAGNLLTVTNTPNAIINWGSFSIGANEITKFVQQSASSAVLNRVVGQDPSAILGALQSNGRVFLINPNGIVFGAGSQINVGGLVASTMNLSNEDFLAGRLRFSGGLGNSVVNQGNITTPQGGNVYLIGNAVTNNGIITSPKGEVVLAAGNSVELVNPGTPDLRVEVTAPNNQALNLGSIVAESGRVGIYAGLINQSGTINANSVVVGENGQITLKATKNIDLAAGSSTTANGANGASGTSGGSVNVEAGALLSTAGTVEARSASAQGGHVALKADVLMQNGAVLADGASGGTVSMQARNLQSAGRIAADGNAGAGGQVDLQAASNIVQTTASRVSADGFAGDGGSVTIQAGARVFSSTSASAVGRGEAVGVGTGATAGKGGTIKVLGNEIVLRGAMLDASGDTGGGTVLVGGDRHGQNAAVPNAKNTSVNFASTLKADANINGDGGKVVVWSDGKTVFNGQASARGGAQGGNGGFIELSGKEKISFGGYATAGAPKGKAGLLQLDPMNIIIDSAGSVSAYSTIDLADPNPGMNEGFGERYTVLPNGNIVALDPRDSFTASNAGAAYLFNGTTGALISSLTGSSSLDGVGQGVTVLTNGNYVVQNGLWNNGPATFAGAATFANGVTGVSGIVSGANSLVGTSANDFVGLGGVFALPNGNYVAVSPSWSNGPASAAGAVTFGSGSTGVSGAVSVANSLVGSNTNDFVGGNGITVLSNSNYVVKSPDWANGAATKAGAVTFGSGVAGVSGTVSAVNSLVGTTAADRVGSDGVIELTNGNYVVVSPFVTIGGQASAGAVTWGSGAAGVTGTVSVTNSLTGTTSVDAVGSAGVVALANGNYVVRSPNWNNGGVAASAGAVTFGSGATGISGAVSAANSLVGTTAGDQVGSAAVTELANGNYVVGSPEWANGLASRAGAATWGSGTTGIIGAVTTANSLVGSNTNDAVGSSVTALPNGNYVAISANWDNGATSNAGALTWGSGLTGVNGVISAANSLVGTSINDLVGSHGITVLTNSNYVVRSPNWRNGVAGIAGAVTFATGTAAIIGAVSTANSLVGTTTGDSVGLDGVVALPNGNYVVRIPGWNNGGVSSAGAVTFGSGTSGITGAVSAANSLVGTSTFDFVGDGGITVLPNGNYVVSSPSWSNGGAISAGAVTFGSGTSGITGAVSAANSLVGSTSGDRVGNGGITALANGNYVVASTFWSNGLATNAGAVTFGNGLTGITGVVSPANSLVGTTTNDQVGVGGVTALPNGNYVVRSYEWANGAATQAGAVTFGNGATGISGAVSAANSLVGTTSGDFVGEGGITVLPNGNYVVSSFNWSNSGAINTGAVTWGSGSIGVSGAVSAANSLVGVTANDFVGATFPDSAERNITPLANGNFLVGSERYTNGGLAGAGKLQIYVPGGLNNPLVFSDSPASTVTITPSQITDITNTGTAIVLQANNDITLAAASDIITTPVSGNGGDITLQAGRSVMLNSNINSANGNITIVANETAANGVFDAHRSAGAAEIRMAPGTTINSGTGNISLTLSTGAGLTNNQSGAIEVANLTTTTGSVSVVNTGSGVGGGPIDMVATPAAITSPLITLHGSAIGTTTGHVHLDPGAGSVFATANTGGISVEQIAGTLNTGQYSFSAPAGQEVRLASSSGNINVNNSLTLAGENLVLQTFGPYDIQFASGRAIGGSGLLTLQPDAGRSVLLPASGTTTLNVDTDVLTGTLAFAGPGGTLTGTGNVILHAGTTFDWGFGGTVAGTGVLGTDGAVNITSANLSRQWDNFGIATWTPGAADSFTLTAAGVLNNQLGAKFIINSPLASFGGLRAITGAGAINNAGEFNKELNGSPVSTLVATTFNNQTGGAVHVNSGVLQFTGGGTDAGAYVVPAGSALDFTGGARTLGAGSSVTGAGDVNFSGSQLTTFAAGSTYAPTGGTTVSGGTVSFNQGGINVFNLVMTGGSLAGSAAVAVSNSLNWSGGTVDTTGTLTTAGPSTISATDTLNGPWANNGAADLTGGALTVGSLINAGTFNVSGGTHTLSGPTSGTGAVNIGGGTTTIGGTYNQASTAVNAGTVTFTGTPTLNSFVQTGGTANLNAGGTATDVNLGGASGTLNLGGGTLSTSNYTQTAGAVAGSGALNVSGALIWSGGTIDTTGTLTTSGSSAISATDTLNGAWANNGAANITGGALAINALTNTATLTLSGGTHALNGPTSGAGAIDFSGATVTVGGTYNPANTSVSGGLVTFTNTPTLNNYVQAGGTVNLNAGGSATSVNLSGAGSILNLSGGTLTASSHTQSGGAVTGTGALITAGMNWTGGTIDTAGTLTISGASIISATDTLNGAWINNGTADITGGTLTTNALTNAGTLNILGGNQTLNGPTGGAGAINFAGGTASVGGTFNPLTTNVTAGSVTFTSAPALNNYTQTGGAANLTAGGSAANVNLSGGTLNLGGVFNPSSYTQSGGAVTGTGALNVTGPMNWTGGTLDTTGTLTTAGASNFSASDTLNGAWNNNGAAVLSGGAMTFNTLNNTGTLDITGGTQTFNGPTLGTGGLTVNGGTATINGSYSHANTNVAAGTLTFASAPALANFTQTGGTANFNAGGSATNINLSGAGSTLNVNGGTLIATNFTQSGGVFDGAGAFSATTLYNVTGGTQTGTGATILAPGSTYTPGTTTLGRSLIVQGTLNENAGDTLTIAAGRTLTVNGTLNNAGTITGAGDLVTALGSTFSLSGALAGTGASVLNGVTNASSGASINRNVVSNAAFNLSGSMSVNGGQLQLNNGGSASGLMNVANGGVLLFSGGTYNFASGGFTGAGTTTIAGATVNVPSLNLTGFGMVTGGQLNVAGTTSIAPAGVMTVTGGVLNANGQLFVDGTLQSTPPGVINTNGAVTIGGVLDLGNGTLQTTSLNVIGSGVLKGKGTINGNVVLGGMFKPGASPGVVNINGNYTQTGTLEVELGGTTPGTGYDQIVVSGTANLGGTLNVVQFGNFISPPGATFQVVRAGTINGTFANTNVPLIFSGLNASYTSQFVELGSATITTASTLTQVDPAIIKQDKELVATIKKLLGSDPVEEALNPASSEKKSNTPNCN